MHEQLCTDILRKVYEDNFVMMTNNDKQYSCVETVLMKKTNEVLTEGRD